MIEIPYNPAQRETQEIKVPYTSDSQLLRCINDKYTEAHSKAGRHLGANDLASKMASERKIELTKGVLSVNMDAENLKITEDSEDNLEEILWHNH